MKKIIKLNEQEFQGLVKDVVTETLKNIGSQFVNKEFHNFAGLAKEDTGLSVDIFLDQCESYKEFNHPFWLYFRNSYGNLKNYIPITIQDKKVLFGNKKTNVYQKDIIDVIKFIDTHYNDICAIAEEKMDVYDLYKKLKNLSESAIQTPTLLTEMSKLSNVMTGLPFDVWIGMNPKNHWVGVKFPPNNSIRKSSDYAEMSVPDCEVTSFEKYEQWRADYVEALIKANEEALMELGHNPQKYSQVCNSLVKIGSNLKPITQEPEFYPVSDTKFDYTKVRNKEGKFNFVDKNKKLCNNEWFDIANDFVKNKEGYVRAYTLLNGVEGFLYINPIKWVPITNQD